jgi:6-phosphogluconate dehydrogenase
MRLAMVGLGRMGANMARRLMRRGIEVVGYNRSPGIVHSLAADEGMSPAGSVSEVVALLQAPRIVWLMLPAGGPTESAITIFSSLLQPGDVLVDGGNANYHDSQRRAAHLAEHGIHFVDAGTSGGIWGLENGYCLMVGGRTEAIALLEPALQALAPESGWAHVGPAGAGHFTKMIHNGVEYGMMQSLAEGLALLQNKKDFNLDLAQITELWRHGSVVRSWLLDLTAQALQDGDAVQRIEPFVADSGEGRWSAIEAIEQGLPAPAITQALHARFASQGQADFGNRLLAVMRQAFGGHAVKTAPPAAAPEEGAPQDIALPPAGEAPASS